MSKQIKPASVEQDTRKRNILIGFSEMWKKQARRLDTNNNMMDARSGMIYLPENERRIHDLHKRVINFIGHQPEKEILEHIETCADVIDNLVVIYEINDQAEGLSGQVSQTRCQGSLVPSYAFVRNR